MIYNAPRSASVRTKTKTTMFAMTRDIFQGLVRRIKLKQYKLNRELLDTVKVFKTLTSDQKEYLAYETVK